MSDITEKLLAMDDHRGDGLPTQYVNPDGPEAVEAILALRKEVEEMKAALRACRHAVGHGTPEPRRNVREIVDEALAPSLAALPSQQGAAEAGRGGRR